MNYFPGKFIRSFDVLNSINKNKYMTDPQNKDFKTAKRYFKVVDSLKSDEMAKVFGTTINTKPIKKSKPSAN